MRVKNIVSKFCAVVLVCLYGQNVAAQQDYSLYNLSSLQQTLYTNPANQVDGRIYIGIPALSSMYFNATNKIATPKDLFENTADGTRLRVSHLDDLWSGRNNYVGFHTNLELLAFGFRIKERNYLHFTVNENIFSRVTLPGDLLTFPFYGNASFDKNGGELDFSGLGIDLMHYRTFGLGFQRQ